MKRIHTILLSIASLAAGQHASAAVFTYSTLMSGLAEAPPNASPAIGSVTVIVNDSLNTLDIQASFSGLTGTTTAAHIHSNSTMTPFSGTAGVAVLSPNLTGFPLGVTNGSYTSPTFDMTLASSYTAAFITANGGTTATAFAALINNLNTGRAYFNIHTSAFTGGEIRGFLVPVPEPGTATLAGLLAAGLFIRRRR